VKKLSLFFFLALPLLLIASYSFSREPVKIDVLYMNHGPMQPTLRSLDKLFRDYGDKIKVFGHDFESEEGERFKAEKGIRQHIPLVIWIEGKSTVELNGKPITFSGFPSGSGPAFFQGKWDLADLKTALDQATSKN
jgi:hypothetical protein